MKRVIDLVYTTLRPLSYARSRCKVAVVSTVTDCVISQDVNLQVLCEIKYMQLMLYKNKVRLSDAFT